MNMLEVILSSVFGALAGSLVFGVWLVILMSAYILLYGSYPMDLFGASSLPKPILLAFLAGLIFGGIHGVFTGLIIKTFDISELAKSILMSLIIIEILIVILFCLTSGDTNFFGMMASAFIDRFYDLVKTSLVMLVPSIVSGILLKQVISFIVAR